MKHSLHINSDKDKLYFWNVAFSLSNDIQYVTTMVNPAIDGVKKGKYTLNECIKLCEIASQLEKPVFSKDIYEAHLQLTEFSNKVKETFKLLKRTKKAFGVK